MSRSSEEKVYSVIGELLSQSLIKSQNVSTANQRKLAKLHSLKYAMFSTFSAWNVEEYKETLKALEFSAQEAWGFEKDEDNHQWWLSDPNCQCPKMDNKERIGHHVGYIHTSNCPVHGIESFTTELSPVEE